MAGHKQPVESKLESKYKEEEKDGTERVAPKPHESAKLEKQGRET